MSASYRTLISFLPILLMPCMVIRGQAQLPVPGEGQPSAWWYPLGNPEATRNNPVPTTEQKAEDLKIKWRTGRLKNSPVLLVGGIRTEEGKNDQQIVGIEEGTNRVTILTSTGFVDTSFNIIVNNLREAKLTGLFNSSAPSFLPVGRPNLLGISIEQEVVGFSDIPFGLLMKFGEPGAQPLYRLGLRDQTEVGRVAGNTASENKILSIIPIAVYTPAGAPAPAAYAILSQDSFIRTQVGSGQKVDTMINSIRKYALVEGRDFFMAEGDGQPVFLAPKPYGSAPALFTTSAGLSYISLSTERYDMPLPIAIRNAGDPTQTSSDLPSPVLLTAKPNLVSVESVPGAKASSSHFIMTDSSGTRVDLRIYTESRIPNDSPRPRMFLTRVAEPPGAVDNFDPLSITPQESWTIVVADLDGTAPGFPAQGTEQLVNNPGPELIATTSPDGTELGGKSWVYVFRRNFKALINTRAFYYFTRQLLSGTVVAAGDIVFDQHGRQELLLMHNDSLSILQLKPYSRSDEIRNPVEARNTPFEILQTFSFDSPIMSVAISDLEGDGENDIVVSTEQSTYAIGKVQPDPYPFDTDPNPFNKEYCPNDTITVSWKRNVGSEDSEVEVNIVGEELERPFGPSDILGDSVRFTPANVLINSQTFRVQPGVYRIVISSLSYPHIADTSEPFTVVESSITGFDFPNDLLYEIGSEITDTITLKCVDDVSVQRSIGDTLNWEDISESLTDIGPDSIGFSDVLLCPDILRCGANEERKVYYRLMTADDTMAVREVKVRIPQFPFRVDTGRSHHRSLTWEATDFPCRQLTVSLSADGGRTWSDIGGRDVAAEQLTFTVPDEVSDSVMICVQCSNPDVCGYGVKRFVVSKVSTDDYVYPNPFDPEAPGTGGGGAEIVYSLENSANVSITIYDAARSVVRELVKSEMRPQGRNRGDFWDGRNYRGENVANGTYICVISTSNGEQIILPIAVVKRR